MTALLIRTGNPATLPLDLLLSAIPSLPRPALERLTARMIDALDTMDGDTDVEANGDELDGTGGEDDFYPHWQDHGYQIGCPVSDPGEDGDHDEPDGRELLP